MKKIVLIAVSALLAVAFIALSIDSAVNAAVIQGESVQEVSLLEGEYNEAVEVYREAVNTYSSQYKMIDYIDVVMKMLSVYSKYHSTDVMSSSYSYLNKKYPHKNEGITNFDYSIRTGIHQLSEWVSYIESKYNAKPILNNEYLMVLIQAYELQDKEYIDYALGKGGKGYSADDTAEYCTQKSFVSKKPFSAIITTFAFDVINLRIDSSDISMPMSNGEINDTQRRIVQLAIDYKNYSQNGIRTQGGYCLRFANDIVQRAGLNIKRADCARCSGAYYGVSNDWSNIPVGALVYCNASQQYGHVGVYIGDGQVVHCTTYKSSSATLLKTVPNGYVVKQSLTSFVSGYKGKCWGFSGAWTKEYPCKPSAYMTALH